MLIIRLIEEDIFTIIALSGILFKNALSGDAMLVAQLLPKLVANFSNAHNCQGCESM